MKTIITSILILGLTFIGYSQKSETTLNYEVALSSSLESVGGDLVISDESFPVRLDSCPSKNFKQDILFQGGNPQTIYIKIDNSGADNNCVTLTVDTTSGLQKVDVASNDQTGILKFDKVKKAFVSITKGKITSDNPILKSTGKAIIWF